MDRLLGREERKTYLLKLLLLGVLMIAGSVLGVYPILLIQSIVDLAVVGAVEHSSAVLWLGAGYLLMQIARSFLSGSVEYLAKKIQADLSCSLQIHVFDRLKTVRLASIKAESASDLRTTLMQDTQFVSENMVMPYTELVQAVLTFAFGLYFMIQINLYLTFLVLPLGLTSTVIAKYIAGKYEKNVECQRRRTMTLWKVFAEGIQGFLPIRLHGFWEEYLRDMRRRGEKLKANQVEQARLESLRNILSSALFMATIGLIMICSTLFVIYGLVSIGGLTAIMMYNHMLVDPLIAMQEVSGKLVKRKVSLRRIRELLELPKETRPVAARRGGLERVVFDQVSFSYDGAKDVIRGFSSVLRQGDCVWICGESGSGKSTLVNLLTGVYSPTRGQIRYDYTGCQEGLPNVSYMGQDEYLFDRSVRENIRVGNKDLTDEAFIRLIGLCELSDVMAKHQDRPLGENGATLSGGERKRVLIARALADHDADLYVFDELSASLDQETYSRIVSKVDTLLAGKLRVYIEHNQSMAGMAGVVLRMNQGVADIAEQKPGGRACRP